MDRYPTDLMQVFASDPFASGLGISVVECHPGYARATLTLSPEMQNFHGVTHGGVIFSLADTAFAAASNSHNRVALALNVNINFLVPTRPGVLLTAVATEEKLGGRTGLYRIAVEDDQGQLVALVHGTVFRKDVPVTVGGEGKP